MGERGRKNRRSGEQQGNRNQPAHDGSFVGETQPKATDSLTRMSDYCAARITAYYCNAQPQKTQVKLECCDRDLGKKFYEQLSHVVGFLHRRHVAAVGEPLEPRVRNI